MQGELVFLGTGGSMGVPVIGCPCSICSSTSKYNKRNRSSALIRVPGKSLLIDAGPEIRMQLLSFNVKHIDGAIITHAHYDHIAAVDDLKAFTFIHKQKLKVLLSQQSFDEISHRHFYLMNGDGGGGLHFDFEIASDLSKKITFAGVDIKLVSYYQNEMPVFGVIVGDLAYISDIKQFNPGLVKELSSINTLIVSALRQTSSAMHFSLDEAIAFSQEIGAKRTYFTHMAHEIDYHSVSALLPPSIHLAYDGLTLPFTYSTDV